MSEELERIGKFLMTNFRDSALSSLDTLTSNNAKAPSLQKLQLEISNLSEEQKEILRRVCTHVLDSGLHDFLFAIQEASENNEGIEILVDGEDIAKKSDGLQGELYSEDGWIHKYSANS